MGNLCSTSRKLASYSPGAVESVKTLTSALHSDVIFDLACTSESDVFLSCSNDMKICRFNWRRDQILDEWKGHSACVNKVVWSSKCQQAISCSRDKSILFWKPGQERPVSQLLDAHKLTITSIVLHPSQTTICSGSRDYNVRFWDIATQSMTQSFEVNLNVVTCMRWIPNTPAIVQCGEDLMIRIWDQRSPDPVQQFEGGSDFPLCCDISADGNALTTGYNGFNPSATVLKHWDLRVLRQTGTFVGHEQSIRDCKFSSHNGRDLLISTGKDQTIKIWDPTDFTCLSSTTQSDMSYCTSVCLDPKRPGIVHVSCAEAFVTTWEITDDFALDPICRTRRNRADS